MYSGEVMEKYFSKDVETKQEKKLRAEAKDMSHNIGLAHKRASNHGVAYLKIYKENGWIRSMLIDDPDIAVEEDKDDNVQP